MSRAVGLIIIPIAIYATTFYYHFALQTNFNAGAGGMSIEYQQTLHGGELPPTARDVFLGSLIRLRQYKPSGPFLHSHVHMYPEGSKQQQVTGYHHRDQNNLWIFRRPFAVNVTYIEEQPDEQAVDLTQLANGDSIRIQHVVTGRFLHSHPVAPPVSSKEHHYEVSCYGHHPSKYSDPNDNWRIVVCDERGNAIETSAGSPAIPLTAIGTKFRLQHTLLGCYLHTIGKALPQWGFKQNEITCSREALRTNTIWVVELNEHPKMPADMPTIFYPKLSFFGKLIELNRKMWDTNAGLSADHPFASRPMSWPLLSRGIGFWNGNHIPDTEKIHKQKEDLKNGVRPPIQGNPQNGQQLVHVDENGNVVEKNPEEAAAAQGQVVMTPEDQMEAAQLTEALGKFKSCQVYMIGNPLLWWAASGSLLVFVVTLAAFRFATRRGLPLADHIKSNNSSISE